MTPSWQPEAMHESAELGANLEGLVVQSAANETSAATIELRRALALELIGSMPAGRLTLEDFLAAKHAHTVDEE